MKIQILEFIPNSKGNREGYVDFRVDYSEDKWEIFRNVAYFIKDEKRWLNMPVCLREEKWQPVYYRSPSTTILFREVINELDNFMKDDNNSVSV